MERQTLRVGTEKERAWDRKEEKTKGKRDSKKESEIVIDREARQLQGNYDNEGCRNIISKIWGDPRDERAEGLSRKCVV